VQYPGGVRDKGKAVLWFQVGWVRQVEVFRVIIHALEEPGRTRAKTKTNMKSICHTHGHYNLHPYESLSVYDSMSTSSLYKIQYKNNIY